MTTVIEHSTVAPPPEAAVEMSLPLSYFDVPWIYFSHIHRLIFYEQSYSKQEFVDNVIPKLKHSLSLALKHFPPLAGKFIVLPENSGKPSVQYIVGDTVSLLFAESTADFYALTGNRARKAGDFHHLIPLLPPPEKTADESAIASPVFALQVTLFPEVGLSVGITNDHVVGDASSIFEFMKTWASITRNGDEDGALLSVDGSSLFPIFDRSLVKDPRGLTDLYLFHHFKNGKLKSQPKIPTLSIGAEKIRATFTINRESIQQLKNLVSAKRPKLAYISTFTIVCAYSWICLVKSRPSDDDEGLEFFGIAADCRGRSDSPIPPNYFGNCIGGCAAKVKRALLVGEEGFIIAAESMGEAIFERLEDEEGFMKGAEKWVSGSIEIEIDFKKMVSIAGSPKFNYYLLDFGLGKPKKFEFVSIDITGALSLNGSIGPEGGIEIGFSLPENQMNALASIFDDGLRSLLSTETV